MLRDVPPISGLAFVLIGIWWVMLFIYPDWVGGLMPRSQRNIWWLRERWRIRLVVGSGAAILLALGTLVLVGVL